MMSKTNSEEILIAFLESMAGEIRESCSKVVDTINPERSDEKKKEILKGVLYKFSDILLSTPKQDG